MSLQEKCFRDLDFLYPKMDSSQSDPEIDRHLMAALSVLYLDEIKHENKRRLSKGLPRISPADIVAAWHSVRRTVEL